MAMPSRNKKKLRNAIAGACCHRFQILIGLRRGAVKNKIPQVGVTTRIRPVRHRQYAAEACRLGSSCCARARVMSGLHLWLPLVAVNCSLNLIHEI